MEGIRVIVHTTTHPNFDLEISPSDTVADLVQRIREQLDTERKDRVRLICAGKEMIGYKELRDYGINQGTSIHHIHCAVQASPAQPATTFYPEGTGQSEGSLLLPEMEYSGGTWEAESPPGRGLLDFLWGFAMGTCLGVLMLFVLDDSSIPRVMQIGILAGVGCNVMLSGSLAVGRNTPLVFKDNSKAEAWDYGT